MAEYAQRMESFPFDSSPDVEYDEDGYPIYDRAVGAEAMRRTFEKYFSDGVFPNPAEEMQVSAGDSGLTVKVSPGTCIIKGSMGTLLEEVTLTLDTAVQGNTVYGVMAAFDNNEDRRSVYLRVAKGTPGTNEPPEPDRTTPNIYEYRIADVTLNSGATSVSAANVTNNKGTKVWPYAAPFVELDVSAIVLDARAEADEIVKKLDEDANTSLENVQKFISDNMELIESAIDGTVAGHLQQQIDDLRSSTLNADSLDPKYLALQKESPEAPELIGLVEKSVGTRELKDECVTAQKIDDAAVNEKVIVDGETIHKGAGNKLYAAPDEDGTFGDYFMFSKSFIDTYLDGIPSDITLATTLSNMGSIKASKANYVVIGGKAYLFGASSGSKADVYVTSKDGTTQHKTAAITGGKAGGLVVSDIAVSGGTVSYSVVSADGSAIASSYGGTAKAQLNVTVGLVKVTSDGAINVEAKSDNVSVSQSNSYSFDQYTGYARYFLPAKVGDGYVMGGVVLSVDQVGGGGKQRCGCLRVDGSGAITKKTATGELASFHRNSTGASNSTGYEQGVMCQASMSGTGGTVYFGFTCTTDMATMTVKDENNTKPSGWTAVSADGRREGVAYRYADGSVQTRTYTGSSTPQVQSKSIGELAQPLAPSLDVPNGIYHELPGGAFMVKDADGIVLAKDWSRFRVAKKWSGTNVAGIVQGSEVPSAMTSETVDGTYTEIFSNGTVAAVMFINVEE